MPDAAPTATVVVPLDGEARCRVAADLDRTLFVEAGAGSGKTTALVRRVLAIVADGEVELRHVAAITFTEKAGTELRDRLRTELESGAAGCPDPAVTARYRAALDQLDGAAIGTLHAFAQRLLAEHPIEAGLPPRVEVSDEVSSGVAFEDRWAAFRDQLLEDPAIERALLLLFATGVRHTALRALAQAFDDNWDLVEERVPETAPEPPSVHELLGPVLDQARAVCREVADCRDPEDRLAVRLCEIADHLEGLEATADEVDLLEALAGEVEPKPPSFAVARHGRKGSWNVDIDGVRARAREAGEALTNVCDTVANACARVIGARLRGFTLGAAHQRRTEGRLEFHDLLVLARALVRDPKRGGAVRHGLQQRYRRLLLDEFQDTDPIQVELAVRIAAAEPCSEEAGRASWSEVEVAPGHLFLVGDPKQSIYRFRRADIATFLAARSRFGADGGLLALTANFRTGASIVEWVNDTFGALMAEPPVGDAAPPRPDYLPLDAVRPDAPAGAGVAVVGRTPHPRETTADELRALEANDVVALVARVVEEGWLVSRPGRRHDWAPARLGDITILVPARTSLPFLEQALDDAGIGYRAESSSLVYATRAVRDLLMVARAVDDPTDELRLVAALRTPLLGCGDDELFMFRQVHGGQWNFLAEPPASAPEGDRVVAGLAYLRSLHERRTWSAPSELLGRIARDRRAFELGVAEGRPRDVWRRLRFVIDQARAWSEATGGNLRRYLAWVELQTAEGARVAESVLPETDDDAVRIMTIHAAKGLEFPVTILSGMSTAPNRRAAPAEVAFPPAGPPGYRFGRRVVTEEFASWAPIDEQMSLDERVRLLYVAATRARDHLVVSLHRRERATPAAPASRTNAELLIDGIAARLDALPDALSVASSGPGSASEPHPASAGVADVQPTAAADHEPDRPLPAYGEWARARDAVVAAATRATTVAATALTDDGSADPVGLPGPGRSPTAGRIAPDPGLQKRPRDLDLPPWMRGRYGTAVGRAVHGVLQTVDLRSGEGLEAMARAQCEAEAVTDRIEDVVALARAALASPSVRAAAGRPHWRELYVCTPTDGGRLVEGYIDLLYRGDDGLVVVDHKTASTADPAALERRVEGYRLQGGAYALSVAAATGEPVERVAFVFLTPEGAVEWDLPDLAAAIDDVRALLANGREIVVEEPLD